MAYRPRKSRWTLLDRLEFNFEEQHNEDFDFDNWRIVNNLNANYKMNTKTQIALQYGAKYVKDTIDEEQYSGYTDLIGLETRYDLTQRWDIGLRGSALHSWNANQFDYSAGVSLGYNVMQNAWVSVGYNLLGFEDEDFSRGNFTAQGPFVTFRIKVDQQSVRDIVKKWIFK
jgi:opacity protein-like surface antigen